MNNFGTVFFALAMVFAAWVVIASDPLDRLNRGCAPVQWGGKAVTSIAAMGSAGAEVRAAAAVDRAFVGCRIFWFRQFFSDEYDQLLAEQRKAAARQTAPPKNQEDIK